MCVKYEIIKRNNIYWDLPYPYHIIHLASVRHRAWFSIHKSISDRVSRLNAFKNSANRLSIKIKKTESMSAVFVTVMLSFFTSLKSTFR